ncbi:M14 family metallopeptidase [Planctomycetota bacterium]
MKLVSKKGLCLVFIEFAYVTVSACHVGTAAQTMILPPVLPWQGASEKLVAPKKNPWITPTEAADFKSTPRYQETVDWLKRLTQAAPQLRMITLGQSPEGRDIWMVIASATGLHTPTSLQANNKPTLLVQAGIHAGEIDGKDAGLMLLRDMTVLGSKASLLDRTNLLFVPILSVDGHERFSPYGRINQRGPIETGWRTNARNLNLNRDYAKLDTPEVRAIVRAINTWQPDLYFDIHVTDGVDYQYDITWGYNGTHAYSPASAAWMDEVLTPTLMQDLKTMGHIPGPLVFAADDQDIHQGLHLGTGGPRYSNGYGDLRHLPSVLVENHSLKSYRQRVLGTYVLLESTLRTLGQHGGRLQRAIQQDRHSRPKTVPLTWQEADDSPTTIEFLGISSETYASPITGKTQIAWTGQPVSLDIPLHIYKKPDLLAQRPRAYWIPPAWTEVIARLSLHGVHMERFTTEQTVSVEMLHLEDPSFAAQPYEGHVRVTATHGSHKKIQRFVPGSVRVPTDQALGDLAILLLEPDSPDSFFQWGFFSEVLQRVEYVEAYVMEPMAQRMLAEDPELQTVFAKKLAEDPNFASDAKARLLWFYQKTPFFDDQWCMYPVAREY